MTKQTAFEKFSKTHRSTCRVNVFSGDRKCTCGRDQAIRDYWDMERKIKELRDMMENEDYDEVLRLVGRL